MTSTDRDVKKNPPSRIPASNTHSGVGMRGRFLLLQVIGTRILNTRMLNRVRARITIPIPVVSRYEIIILPLNY